MPIATFIIPAYNVSEYIVDCIKSIQQQTISDIEIIVVNDGSIDDTAQKVLDLSKEDERIILVNKLNEGVSEARNTGLEKAKGEWIVFVDGDDYLSEEYLSHMLDISSKTEAEFCMSTDCFTQKGELQSENLVINRYNPIKATELLLSPRVEVGCWNKMFKKNLLTQLNLKFRKDLFYGEGLYFITRVSQLVSCVGVSNRKVYYYRQNNLLSATKHFDIDKIHNGWATLELIEKEQILKDEAVTNALLNHKCLFSLAAVTKILNSKKIRIYKADYEYYLHYVRHTAWNCMTGAYVTYKIKIKLAICCLCPNLLSYLSIKSQQQRSNKSV